MSRPPIFLGLGSNLGDRERHLRRGLAGLRARGVEVRRRSSLYLTEPVGGPPQGWFLNAAAEVESSLDPEALLGACLAVERDEERERGVRNGPRTLDVDILFYGDLLRTAHPPLLPHPRLPERRFVLVPLAELAPDLRHPALGSSVRELLLRCPDASAVERQGPWGT